MRLARDGFDVVVNDVAANKEGIDSTVKEIEAIGRRSHGIICDVTKFDDVEKMIDEVFEKMGKLDVSVSLIFFVAFLWNKLISLALSTTHRSQMPV